MNLFTRRKVLQRLLMMLPTVSVLNRSGSSPASEQKKYKSLEDLFREYPRDRHAVLSGAEQERKNFLHLEFLKDLNANGAIVEFGFENSNLSSVLRSAFGERYDLINPLRLIEIQNISGEVTHKTCPAFEQDVEIVWNHVCSWQGSPRTRLSVLTWARKNLKVGGLYVDETLEKIPSNADYSGLQVIFKDRFFTVFKKTINT